MVNFLSSHFPRTYSRLLFSSKAIYLNIRHIWPSLRDITALWLNIIVSARFFGCEILTNMHPTCNKRNKKIVKVFQGINPRFRKALWRYWKLWTISQSTSICSGYRVYMVPEKNRNKTCKTPNRIFIFTFNVLYTNVILSHEGNLCFYLQSNLNTTYQRWLWNQIS